MATAVVAAFASGWLCGPVKVGQVITWATHFGLRRFKEALVSCEIEVVDEDFGFALIGRAPTPVIPADQVK